MSIETSEAHTPKAIESLTEARIYSQKFDNTIVVRLPTAAQEILLIDLAGAAAPPSTPTATA